MKRVLLTGIIVLAIILSTVLLSACEFSKSYSKEYNNNQLASIGAGHYLDDPNINNPDLNSEGEDEAIEVGEDEIYENIENNNDNDNDNIGQVAPENPNLNKDILIKALVSNLNIRSAPNTTNSIVGTMKYGAMVPYVGVANSSWYETIYKGKKAYISQKYTQLVAFDTASKQIENVIDEGKLLLGFPYIFGAQRYHWGPSKAIKNTDFVMGEFDCSSLTQYAYYKGAGVILDLTTRTQIYQGTHIEKQNLKRGDLMFFTNSSRQYKTGNERVGHVAIYLGDNYILHTASDYATIEPMNSTRWNYYISARRFLN